MPHGRAWLLYRIGYGLTWLASFLGGWFDAVVFLNISKYAIGDKIGD